MTAPLVHILTWCQDLNALYGSLLTFKTLRTGFPTAEVVVVDNASHPEARAAIQKEAERVGAGFRQIEQQIAHHAYMEIVLSNTLAGPVVFLDPDLVFWRSVEDWDFKGSLIAGRLLPAFNCEYTGTLTHPRLHTSFWWIPEMCHLRVEVDRVRRERFDWNPLAPAMFPLKGAWQRFDTGANLYAALPDRMRPFTETELDAFDHLLCGTHLHVVAPKLQADDAAYLTQVHDEVRKGNLTALRGAWRKQEEMFARRQPDRKETP